ncbi:MAG: tRNA (cytidine(34)-2'-O)-methyltransferase [Thermoguttaceae bacterium]|nr:tRNA (cytidine(34)-2'-O)-methyltransferase [Thermoguttaceae bacterium]
MERSQNDFSEAPLFHVVLYHPEIPNNTGSVGRTCVGLGAKLWLVRPLGFQITDHKLKRAGLDYWPKLNFEVVNDWNHLQTRITEETSRRNRKPDWWFFSKKAVSLYFEQEFHAGDVFVYGPESVGLPESMLEEQGARCLRIPVRQDIRSLNLAVSVGITLFEAVRQLS